MIASIPKLLISDVDGTLVRDDKSLSARTEQAIKRLRNAGIAVSLISARPPSGMYWIAERLGIEGPMGAFNGGTLFMADGAITHAERLDKGVTDQILGMLEAAHVEPWVFAEGKWMARRGETLHASHERKSANVEPTLCDDFADLTMPTDKIVGVSDDHALLARLEREACDRFGRDATIKRSQPYYLDFTATKANKGEGVTEIARAFGVHLEDVLVIGDGHNDVAMFERAGNSVAMGNADPEVRAKAKHTTVSNEEDGVAVVIENLLTKIGA